MCRFTVRGERDDARLAEAEEREQLRRASGAWLGRPSASGRVRDGVAHSGRSIDKDEVLRLRVEAKEDGISNLYVLHDEFVPLVKRATLMLSPYACIPSEKCYRIFPWICRGRVCRRLVFCPDSGFGGVVRVGRGHRGACGSLEDGFQWQES